MKNIGRVVVWLVCGVLAGGGVNAAEDVTSASYVKSGLVAHWDGIDNVLENGARRHDAATTTWYDLSGNANHVWLPTDFVQVEPNAMLSCAVRGLTTTAARDASKTNKYPGLASLKGLAHPDNTGNAYTLEVVMQCVGWVYQDNYANLQPVVRTPRGTVGYRTAAADGFYFLGPSSSTKLGLANWNAGVPAAGVHTVAAIFHPGANSLYMDGARVGVPSFGTPALSNWATNFTFFANSRTDVRVHAIRIYSRALTPDELARNQTIDRVRFLGDAVPMKIKPIPSQTLDASGPCRPVPVVVNAATGEALEPETDYVCSYADNDRFGTATVTVQGRGDWASCTASQTFVIAPPDYRVVDYIQSSGTQFIDTEILPTPTTRMEAEILFAGSCNRSYGGSVFFGCNEGDLYFHANFGGRSYEDNRLYCWLDRSTSSVKRRDITNRGSRQAFSADAASGEVFFGKTALAAVRKSAAHTVHSIHLFGRQKADGFVEPFRYYGLRVYRWKIWEGETLRRDFVPCLRVYDGAAGLLDRVSGRFFGNAGTGVFAYGADVGGLPSDYDRLEYIESTGTQCIDTGYLPNPTTHLLMDYSMQGACNRDVGRSSVLLGCCENDSAIVFSLNYGGKVGEENTLYTWFDKGSAYGGTVKKLLNIHGHARRTPLEIWAGSAGITNGVNGGVMQAKTTTHMVNSCALMGSHSNDGSWVPHGYFNMRLYGCRIWDGAVAVRDFVPCLRRSDGVAGLYDLVGGTFHGNVAGSDPFVYDTAADLRAHLPADYYELDYLVATGGQVVATGVAAAADTVTSLDVAPAAAFTATASGEITFRRDADGREWGRVSGVTVWEGAEKRRDFVPCRRLSDGLVGFYDQLGNAFYPSTGTAPFLQGRRAKTGVPHFSGVGGSTRLCTASGIPGLSTLSFAFWTRNPQVGSGCLASAPYGAVFSLGALWTDSAGVCCFVAAEKDKEKEFQIQVRTAKNATTSLAVPLAMLSKDAWHHVAFSYDYAGGQARLYLDGKVVASVDGQENMVDPAIASTVKCPITIGNRSIWPQLPMYGEVAQVTLWNRALTSRDVLQLRARSARGDEEGLIGFWPLDCGAEGLKDHVANGNPTHDLLMTDCLDTGFAVDAWRWVLPGNVIFVR